LRTVILHYHLFKNAGTSLDRILKRHFGGGWASREFPGQRGGNTALVEAWIRETPEIRAYSSHTMAGPLPQVEGVTVLPVLFLRDPLARIRSAYKFERQQLSDSWGARLAKETDFGGYVRARLEMKGDRQCRDFQVSRLAAMRPGPEDELERAKQAARMLRTIGVLGFVDDFDGSVAALAERMRPVWPDFTWQSTRANSSDETAEIAEAPGLAALLRDANAKDLALLAWARSGMDRF
jgi:hypothetical protein